jgi:two-component system, OmpR family, phosphate regulon sensor histidine kinase PhoR
MRLRASQQLFVSYLLLVGLLVGALSLAAESLVRTALLDSVDRQIMGELNLAAAYYDATPQLDTDSVADLLGVRSGLRVTIVAPDGTVLGESTRTRAELGSLENHRDRPEIRQAREQGRGRAVRPSRTVASDLLYAALVSERGAIVRVAIPLAEVDAAVRGVHQRILQLGAVAVLLALGFSLAFSFVVTRPLRRVTAAAGRAAAGDLSVRLRDPRRDEVGDLARALDTLTSELQRRVAQLEGERAETQALIDAMAEGVVALSRDGTVRLANPAARRMFGLYRSTPGMPPEAVTRRPEFLRIVKRALDGQAVPPTEFTSDGRSIISTAHPLPQGGAVLVFLDVSELRRLEGVRRDFVANASHELKTPLTAIRGYSETLLDPELPPELTRRFAEVVKSNADRLQRIVDDLLDLSRIESGKWSVQPREISVTEAAREAWSSECHLLDGKQIDLLIEVDPGAERLHADPGALRQIFCNLFSNAIRYTPAGGSVTVRASAADPGDRHEDARPRARIEVIDTGAGIAGPHLSRIFERFYRVDPARSRVEGGTGLGLAIVKHLVEAHGGAIEAESQLGRGTNIRFTLPIA